MKRVLALLMFIISVTQISVAQSIPCSDTNKIAKKLESIRDADQNSRALFIKQMAENDPQKTKALALQMKTDDKENQKFVAGILDNCGWPKGLSEDNNHTLFLVIDHADSEYMAKYFSLLKQQAELGTVAKSDLATLQDRLSLRNGQRQLYGTQTFKNGAIVDVWPVDNIERLDERRKAMGLQPMDEYLEIVKQRFRSEVSWDKTLTVEAAQQKMLKKP